MSKYHDDTTYASNPGKVHLSLDKFKQFWKALPLFSRVAITLRGRKTWFREVIDEHLAEGDARAAVVVQTDPLIVAAYTDELDCVALLYFNSAEQGEMVFELGSRLLTVNTYVVGSELAHDLAPGPKRYDRWVNFYPIIADLLSDDTVAIEKAKQKITEAEWVRCEEMAAGYLARSAVKLREGSPFASFYPASRDL